MGLIDKAMGAGNQQAPQQQKPGKGDDTLQKVYSIGDTLKGGPQAKELFQRAIVAAVMMIYDDTSNPAILQMLKSGAATDLPGALSRVAITIMTNLQQSAKIQAPPDIAIPLFSAIMLLVGEVCTKSGIAQVTMPVLLQAMQKGIGPLGQALRLPPEQIQQMMQNLGQMGQAAQQQQQPPEQAQVQPGQQQQPPMAPDKDNDQQ